MSDLQRITIEYIEFEDRFRLTGEMKADSGETSEPIESSEPSESIESSEVDESGKIDVVTIWLTQRLLNLLLPILFEWLQDRSAVASKNPSGDRQTNEFLQGFAQQAATEQIPQQPPVQSQADTLSWLVREVDIGRGPEGVKLSLKGHNGEEASLSLEQGQLRQWLSIVHNGWVRAEWPKTIWPSWILETAPTTAVEPGKAFH